MKTLLGIILAFAVGSSVAQDCKSFYPLKEGTVLEMKSYNEKDKLTGSVIQKVIKKEETGGSVKVTVNTESFDDKGKSVGDADLAIRCENGVFYMDMKNFLDPKQLEGFEGGDMEVEVHASDMEYPSSLSPGQVLNDAVINIKVGTGGMTIMNMNVKVYNRKVEAEESITTPAGTFSCYKLSSDIETDVMFKVVMHSIEWIAYDTGVVRSESYDKKGKLQGYTLLTSLK